MNKGGKFSRRTALGVIAGLPAGSIAMGADKAASTDARLVALGRQFQETVQALEDTNYADEPLARLGPIEAEIVNTRAETIEGLCVKARAACWALLGDVDPSGEPTTDRRMALSIVRDLITLYDPELERPGAIKKLLES